MYPQLTAPYSIQSIPCGGNAVATKQIIVVICVTPNAKFGPLSVFVYCVSVGSANKAIIFCVLCKLVKGHRMHICNHLQKGYAQTSREDPFQFELWSTCDLKVLHQTIEKRSNTHPHTCWNTLVEFLTAWEHAPYKLNKVDKYSTLLFLFLFFFLYFNQMKGEKLFSIHQYHRWKFENTISTL